MKKINKNILCFAIAGVLILAFPAIKVFASGNISGSLNSRGRIYFRDNSFGSEAMFDSSDIYTLATYYDDINGHVDELASIFNVED